MMVISTTLLGRMQPKFLLKFLLPIFPTKPCFQRKFLLQILLLLSHLPKLQISNVWNHIALHCPQKQILKITKVKQDLTHPPTTSKKEKDKEGQVDMGLILSPPRCFPSLSFSLPKVPILPPSWSMSDENQIKEAFINGGRGHPPSHLKFFLLVFSKLKEDIK